MLDFEVKTWQKFEEMFLSNFFVTCIINDVMFPLLHPTCYRLFFFIYMLHTSADTYIIIKCSQLRIPHLIPFLYATSYHTIFLSFSILRYCVTFIFFRYDFLDTVLFDSFSFSVLSYIYFSISGYTF